MPMGQPVGGRGQRSGVNPSMHVNGSIEKTGLQQEIGLGGQHVHPVGRQVRVQGAMEAAPIGGVDTGNA